MSIPTGGAKPGTWAEVCDPGLRGKGVFLRPKVVADGLDVTVQTVYRRIDEGEIRAVRVGTA